MTTTDEVRFRTITRTGLYKHTEAARRSVLLELYRDNARRLGRGFGFCIKENRRLPQRSLRERLDRYSE